MVAIPAAIQAGVKAMGESLWEQYRKTIVANTVGRLVDRAKWVWMWEDYCYSLYERVGFVHILGRREFEPLENVFTHVNVLNRELAERRYDMARLQAESAPRNFGSQEQVKRMPGEEAVAEYDKLFILGKPGAGKTTLLKHSALRAIEGEIDKVPVFVSLKELSDRGMGIVEFIVHQFKVHRVVGLERFVERLLRDGKALVLLDGLDEVNAEGEKRSRLIATINDFVYQYGECPMLLSCRVEAVDYSFSQFKYVEMADFDEAQMGQYIDRWFVDNEPKRLNCRKALLETPQSEPIRELARVPLLLSLLCLVFDDQNEFPRQRHQIYEEATQALLSKWDSRRNIKRDTLYGKMSVRLKEQMLAYVAATTFEADEYFLQQRRLAELIEGYLQGVPGLTEEGEVVDGGEVLGEMEAQHGILVRQTVRFHSFSHMTLQEFYTARFIVDKPKRELPRLMEHIGDDRWRDVFLLTVEMMYDPTPFFHLYTDALDAMVVGETEIVWLLEWVARKADLVEGNLRPAAVRAAYINIFNLALAVDLDRTRGRAVALDLHDAYVLGLAHSGNLVESLEYALQFARDLAKALELDLHRTPDLPETLDLDRYLADALALNGALDRIHAFSSSSDHDLALGRFLGRAINRAGQASQALGFDSLSEALAALEPPGKGAERSQVVLFKQALRKIAFDHRDIGYRWPLNREQTVLFNRYLRASLFLLDCLELVSDVDPDETLERLLLPPQ